MPVTYLTTLAYSLCCDMLKFRYKKNPVQLGSSSASQDECLSKNTRLLLVIHISKKTIGDTTEDVDGGYYAFWWMLLIFDVKDYLFAHTYPNEAIEREGMSYNKGEMVEYSAIRFPEMSSLRQELL